MSKKDTTQPKQKSIPIIPPYQYEIPVQPFAAYGIFKPARCQAGAYVSDLFPFLDVPEAFHPDLFVLGGCGEDGTPQRCNGYFLDLREPRWEEITPAFVASYLRDVEEDEIKKKPKSEDPSTSSTPASQTPLHSSIHTPAPEQHPLLTCGMVSSLSPPSPRYYHTVSVANGYIWVIGGWDGHKTLPDVFALDPKTLSWFVHPTSYSYTQLQNAQNNIDNIDFVKAIKNAALQTQPPESISSSSPPQATSDSLTPSEQRSSATVSSSPSSPSPSPLPQSSQYHGSTGSSSSESKGIATLPSVSLPPFQFHSAVVFGTKRQYILIYGSWGVPVNKQIVIFDTEKCEFIRPKVKGTPPPSSYGQSAAAVGNVIFFFGGLAWAPPPAPLPPAEEEEEGGGKGGQKGGGKGGGKGVKAAGGEKRECEENEKNEPNFLLLSLSSRLPRQIPAPCCSSNRASSLQPSLSSLSSSLLSSPSSPSPSTLSTSRLSSSSLPASSSSFSSLLPPSQERPSTGVGMLFSLTVQMDGAGAPPLPLPSSSSLPPSLSPPGQTKKKAGGSSSLSTPAPASSSAAPTVVWRAHPPPPGLPCPPPRLFHSCVALGTRLYFVGGVWRASAFLADCWSLDTATGLWREHRFVPRPPPPAAPPLGARRWPTAAAEAADRAAAARGGREGEEGEAEKKDGGGREEASHSPSASSPSSPPRSALAFSGRLSPPRKGNVFRSSISSSLSLRSPSLLASSAHVAMEGSRGSGDRAFRSLPPQAASILASERPNSASTIQSLSSFAPSPFSSSSSSFDAPTFTPRSNFLLLPLAPTSPEAIWEMYNESLGKGGGSGADSQGIRASSPPSQPDPSQSLSATLLSSAGPGETGEEKDGHQTA